MESGRKKKFLPNGIPSNFTIILYFIFLCVIIGIISPNFLTIKNILNNLRTGSYYGIMGLGMTLIFISGGLDLSIGSVLGLSGLVCGIGLVNSIPIVICILFGILVGVVFGIANGICIVKLKIPAMIVTLGTQFIGRGLINVITEGKPVYPFPDSFNAIAIQEFLSINMAVWLLIIGTIILEFILQKTTFGRSIYAIGGNSETARLSGIKVDKLSITVYVISSICAAVAGILVTSRLTSAQVTSGSGYEMDVIAATIIGGTSLFGGVGTAMGTFFGTLFMTFLKSGIVSMRLSAYWQNVVIGFILIMTVGVDQFRRRKKAKN